MAVTESSASQGVPAQKKKLSYLEQREYDNIESSIASADERLRAAHARVEDPAVATDATALTEAIAALEIAQAEHDSIYERWLELTEKIGG